MERALWVAARDSVLEELERAGEDVAIHRRAAEEARERMARWDGALKALEGLSGDLAGAGGGDTAHEAVGNGGLAHVPAPQGDRGEQVLALLRADQGRWWKVREIADTLGVASLRSLRKTLQSLVLRSDVERSADVRYRAVAGRGSDEIASVLGAASREDVLGILRSSRQITWWRANEVSYRLGRSDSGVIRTHLQQLATDGVLIKNADRRYRLPPEAAAEKTTI
jgi:hypothetical protein